MQFDFKASLVAIFLAVPNVGSIHFALDAQVLVVGEVVELDGHQRLQVLGVQGLAVVGIVLHGEAALEAEVLDVGHLAFVLLSLLKKTQKQDWGLEGTSQTRQHC